jgi:ABC-type transport system involved in multi-copper enzyme maturation permease subunit
VRYVGVVLSKELREVSRRKRTFILRMALPLSVFILVFCFLLAANDADWSGQSNFGRNLFFTTSFILLGLGFLLAPAYCAPLIASEREQQTLEVMLSTPIRHYEIVLGKIVSRLILLMLITISATPMLFVCFMFGGVSIVDIAAMFGAIISNIFICTGVSIIASSFFKRSTTAISFSYGILIALGLCSIALWNRMFILSFTHKVTTTAENILFFIAFGMNPYSVIFYLLESVGLPIIFLVGMVADFGFFILCILLASFILRVTAYREKRTGFFKRLLVNEKRSASGENRTSNTCIGRLWQNPVYWKERLHTTISRPSFYISLFLIIYALFFIIYIFTIYFAPGIWFDTGRPIVYPIFRPIFAHHFDVRGDIHDNFILGEFFIIFLALITFSSNSFGKERSRKTLDTLILTPLKNGSIWLGKFFGIWRRIVILTTIPILHLGLCLLHGIFSFRAFWMTLINAFILFFFFTAVGIAFSILFRKKITAIIMTLLIGLVIFLIIPMLVLIIYISMGGFDIDNTSPTLPFLDYLLSISPSYWILSPFDVRNSDLFDFGIGYFSFSALYLGISFIIAFLSSYSLRQRIKME